MIESAWRLDPGQIEVMDREMAAILRHKSSAERLRTSFALWESAASMLKSHLSSTHPEWTAELVNREVAHRMSHGAV